MTSNFVKSQSLKMNVITICTLIFMLSMISLMTFGLGADDMGYLRNWNQTYPLYDYIINNYEMHNSALEIFYLYIFAFFKMFTNNFEIVKFFNTLVTLSVLAYSYYKISSKYYLYMFTYTIMYLFLDFNIDQFRNALAASLSLLSIIYFMENKNKKSLLLMLISILIHNSMIWILIVYFIRNDKIKIISFISIIGLIIYGGLNDILFYFSDLYFHTSHIAEKVYGYLQNDSFQKDASLYSLVFLKSFFIYLFLKYQRIDNDIVRVYFFGLLFYVLLSDWGIFSSRIIRDILILEPILIYWLLNKNKQYILIVLPILLFNLFSKNLLILGRF